MTFIGKTYDMLIRTFQKARKTGVSPFEIIKGPHEAKKIRKRRRSDIDEEDEETDLTIFTYTPPFVTGTMKEYQIEGLNWLIRQYENNLNGILADEMGLGKTLQTLSFLCFLKQVKKTNGPSLIITPKSTLENWKRECERWTPSMRPLILSGTKDERRDIISEMKKAKKSNKLNFDICVVSYEVSLIEASYLMKYNWECLVIDEAHRVKNENSNLAKTARLFPSRSCILLTGTPLQNNLHELWALLNFICPDLFACPNEFHQWLEVDIESQQETPGQDRKAKLLRQILEPFLLRRIKSEIDLPLPPKKETNLYIGLSKLQKTWYRILAQRDFSVLTDAGPVRQLQNTLVQLRKCCNHPYLFQGVEPGPPYVTNEALIEASSKLEVLDKLLKMLRAKGSKVLIFSQMSRVLDILEDYCVYREYDFCRIDGSTPHDERTEEMDIFNQADSSKFVFLLTTRAGGLGINLTGADTVIIYDSDWNPQADRQALARAHRIGQTRPVSVFRFVTIGTVEEKILERAQQKLRLDQIVIQSQVKKGVEKGEMLSIITHGLAELFDEDDKTDDILSIEDIIRQGEEKTKALNDKFSVMGLDDLNDYSIVASEPDLKIIAKKNMESKPPIDIGRSRRTSKRKIDMRPDTIHEHHLPSKRLIDLVRRDELLYISRNGLDGDSMASNMYVYNECFGMRRHQIQKLADEVNDLTENERQEIKDLTKDLFINWTIKETKILIKYLEGHFKIDWSELVDLIPTKTKEEIEGYYKKFYEYDHLYITAKKKIDKKTKEIRDVESIKDTVRKYVSSHEEYDRPGSGWRYEEKDDLFFLKIIAEEDPYDDLTYKKILNHIHNNFLFEFNIFLKTRTLEDIKRRCLYLIDYLVPED
eukprot:GHVP01003678.1.p1 GENE.GHVP01003678.1~~GHVP01003678.1.p1  ORF type:complete len:875 (-),score=192.97 GHVP01003678.1:84-2708(-)